MARISRPRGHGGSRTGRARTRKSADTGDPAGEPERQGAGHVLRVQTGLRGSQRLVPPGAYGPKSRPQLLPAPPRAAGGGCGGTDRAVAWSKSPAYQRGQSPCPGAAGVWGGGRRPAKPPGPALGREALLGCRGSSSAWSRTRGVPGAVGSPAPEKGHWPGPASSLNTEAGREDLSWRTQNRVHIRHPPAVLVLKPRAQGGQSSPAPPTLPCPHLGGMFLTLPG